MKKIRDSRFEIIRIISMMFIVMYHYTLYGNWAKSTINSFKIQFFIPWGQVGVGLFVMITSYFMSDKNLNLKSAFLRDKKLWIKTIFYSWSILILAFIFNQSHLKLAQIIFAIFPVIFDEYWFITSYIILILLMPVLNSVIKSCNKRQFEIYICIIIVVADIMPYLQNTNPNAPLGGMLSVGAMLAPYLIAAYIKKYNFKLSNVKALILVSISLFVEYLSVFIMSKLSTHNAGKFTGGILPLSVAVGIFLLFINMQSFYSKIINWLASGVLATYLITEHPMFRLLFWHRFLNVAKFEDPTLMFILMGVVIAFLTVISCSIIDHIYQWGYKTILKNKHV